jgi:hypothetical protein
METPTGSEDGRDFTAREVREAAGLSYRQLNDWEDRGAVQTDSGRGRGWRRFSPREVFVLMVCAEIRRRFGVPVERLNFVREFMLKDGANHLHASAKLMAQLGVGVWLLTDLQKTFVLDSELEFLDLMENGYFGGDHDRAFIWIKVNPLVNKLLSCVKEPVHLPAHGRGYEILHQLRTMFETRTPEEHEVLQLIRSGDYDRVEVVMKGDEIRTIRTDRHFSKPDQQDLVNLIQQHDYQTIRVTTRDGRIVSIDQTVPMKKGKPRS